MSGDEEELISRLEQLQITHHQIMEEEQHILWQLHAEREAHELGAASAAKGRHRAITEI